ncbi:MAG: hypothetical protein AB9Q22_00270 [Candidatus Reddybacter sp.]
MKKTFINGLKKNFKNEVFIKISVEDGSLIIKVLVGGLAIANLVANYGSLRSGIDQVVDDSRNFSGMVIAQFKQDERIPDQSIIRAERRLGVPGKIQRFYKKLDKVNLDDNSRNERTVIIDDLKDEFISIIELLEAPEDREMFIAETPELLTSQLGQSLPAPIHGAITLQGISDYGNELFIAPSPELPAPSEPPFPTPNYGSNLTMANRDEDDE